jgi:hypothetical protein
LTNNLKNWGYKKINKNIFRGVVKQRIEWIKLKRQLELRKERPQLTKTTLGWAQVAQAYNPSYLGG